VANVNHHGASPWHLLEFCKWLFRVQSVDAEFLAILTLQSVCQWRTSKAQGFLQVGGFPSHACNNSCYYAAHYARTALNTDGDGEQSRGTLELLFYF
jgi:hypothetical protein